MRLWLTIIVNITACESGKYPSSGAQHGESVTGTSPLSDPEGRLSAGHSHSCGIQSDGTVYCWGTDEGDWDYGQVRDTPTDTFRTVSVGGFFSCGVYLNQRGYTCWGENKQPPIDADFVTINVGVDHACGLTAAGSVQCWGDDIYGQTLPPDDAFKQVSAGYRHSCGVTPENEALCWGKDDNGRSSVPDVAFTQVSAGSFQSCGIDTDGEIHCWGDQLESPPSGTYRQLSVARSGTHACALSVAGHIACWGYGGLGQTDSPEGVFEAVSAGGTHSCAVDEAGTFVCWGQDNYGEATP